VVHERGDPLVFDTDEHAAYELHDNTTLLLVRRRDGKA
jgi:hypothetical protein